MPKADNLLASTFTSVSATMAGISIAVTSVLLFIFYQLSAQGQLDVAKVWLGPMMMGLYSVLLFIVACAYGFLWLSEKEKKTRVWVWKVVKNLGWFCFFAGWSLLAGVVMLLYISIGFVGKILGI